MTLRIDAPDTNADIEIRRILDRESLNGFIVIAGAGSGKTTSLVKALSHVVNRQGARLKARSQQVACITYTEVAAREIHNDVGNSPLASVSTIHSFLWSIAKPFQRDIAQWVRQRLDRKISEIRYKQESYSSRTRTRTVDKDATDLAKFLEQLARVEEVSRYTYGTGSDYAKGTLGHEDVITMVPELILSSKLLPRVLASKHPYIFVDESQDTFANVVEALKHVAATAKGEVCLGFFGDPMQQIYQRGIGAIPAEQGWERIEKPENFRSSNRVLDVINKVRSEADGLTQVSGRSREDQLEGECFFFALPADDQRSARLEEVRLWLNRNSNSGSWSTDSADTAEGVKILVIVHRMAAKRMGFERLYSAFHDGGHESLSQAFDEGEAWPLRPFEEVILPICAAESVDSPSVITVLRESGVLHGSLGDVKKRLVEMRESVTRLRDTVAAGGEGSIGKALRVALEAGLLNDDRRFSAYLNPGGEHAEEIGHPATVKTLDAFVDCSISELEAYFRYMAQESPYSTQHGTKGSEFRNVIVVLDDEEGKYSLYSYEKLFGIKDLSAADKNNIGAGKDSVLERTRRLLYVCVSRARESLAVVVFSRDASLAQRAIQASGVVAGGRILTEADLGL